MEIIILAIIGIFHVALFIVSRVVHSILFVMFFDIESSENELNFN